MKKFMVLALALVLSLSLCACGNSAAKEESAEAETAAAVEEAAEVAEELSDAVDAETTCVEASDPAADTKEAGTTVEKVAVEEDGDKAINDKISPPIKELTSGKAGAIRGATLSMINNTEVRFDQIYLSPSENQTWEEDILGSGYLYPSQTLDVSVNYDNDVPAFDVKIVDENGTEYTFKKIDTRALSTQNMSFDFCMENGDMMVRY